MTEHCHKLPVVGGSGDMQKLFGHNLEKLTTGDPAWADDSDQMTSWGPFQPQPLSGSLCDRCQFTYRHYLFHSVTSDVIKHFINLNILWQVDFGWVPATHQAARSLTFLNKDRGENITKIIGQDKGRDLSLTNHYHGKNRPWLGEINLIYCQWTKQGNEK